MVCWGVFRWKVLRGMGTHQGAPLHFT
jgi:hypothetical protein